MKWTSVKRSLPEKSGTILTFCPTMDEDKPFVTVAWYELPGTDNMEGFSLFPECFTPTHWMHIPQPPEDK